MQTKTNSCSQARQRLITGSRMVTDAVQMGRRCQMGSAVSLILRCKDRKRWLTVSYERRILRLLGWCTGQEGVMEHRLGSRHATDVDVYLRTWGSTVSARGRIRDLSVSGAFISTLLPCRPLLHITVQIAPAGRPRRSGRLLDGQIVRLTQGGIGVEWAELQPELVAQLILIRPVDARLRANSTRWI